MEPHILDEHLRLDEAEQLALAVALLHLMSADIAARDDCPPELLNRRDRYREGLLEGALATATAPGMRPPIDSDTYLWDLLQHVDTVPHALMVIVELAITEPWSDIEATDGNGQPELLPIEARVRQELVGRVARYMRANVDEDDCRAIMDYIAEVFSAVTTDPRRSWLISGATIAGIAIGLMLGGVLAPAIGTAIGGAMGLHGAAALSAGLAWLGGGSLAAGGAGMAGGTTLILGLGGSAFGVSGAKVASLAQTSLPREIVELESVKLGAVLRRLTEYTVSPITEEAQLASDIMDSSLQALKALRLELLAEAERAAKADPERRKQLVTSATVLERLVRFLQNQRANTR